MSRHNELDIAQIYFTFGQLYNRTTTIQDVYFVILDIRVLQYVFLPLRNPVTIRSNHDGSLSECRHHCYCNVCLTLTSIEVDRQLTLVPIRNPFALPKYKLDSLLLNFISRKVANQNWVDCIEWVMSFIEYCIGFEDML